MYRDDRSIPVKRVRHDATTGKYIDAPMRATFLRGPIPMAWLNEAAKLPGKAINLGVAIWWLNGMSKTKTFKLTAKALGQLNISRDAASSALKRLEAQGLIRVQRLPGQRPTVEILSFASNVTKAQNTV